MTRFAEDLTAAMRQFRQRPGFALLVMLTLGSAMGISTALFSIAEASWSREWPVAEADRMVTTRVPISLEEARYWSRHARSFEGLTANQVGFTKHRLEGRRVFFDFVSTNYFDVLRIPIVIGRRFADDDERLAGTEPEAVISHRTWEERFGRDPGIVGRTAQLGGSRFTISGVAAPGFEGAGTPLRRHLWFSLAARRVLMPLAAKLKEPERPREVQAAGRLLPGVTAEQARAELVGLSARFWSERGLKSEGVPLQDATRASRTPKSGQEQVTYYTMLIAIAFLCMIACANVSNLLLARGHARRGEIAVRLSLGASRAQLVRQLMVEALLLSLGAGILGMAFASVLPAHFFSSVPDFWEMVRLDFHLDARVFGWTLLLSVLSCLVFGLAPALSVTSLSASEVLKDTNGQSSRSLRTSLTSMQAFVSVMALGIAGLVLRSDAYTQTLGLARRMEPLVLIRPTFPREYDSSRMGPMKAALLDALVSTSGARNVAAVREEPRAPSPGEPARLAVSTGYFEVMEVPIVAGRVFDSKDATDQIAVVSETLAKTLWPGQSAIGKSLASQASGEHPREVVGVVRDRTSGEAAAYLKVAADQMNVFLVRDSEARFKARIGSIAARLDPNLLFEVVSGEQWLTQTLPGAVLTLRLFGEFGAFALVLTAVGLFSLSEYLVRQKTREIGIRTALGARPRHILSAILEPAAGSLGSGLLAGTLGAIAAGFLMRHWDLPTGVRPIDPMNYLWVGLLMILAALLAIWRPALNAMRVEPSEALRYE